MRAGSKQGLRLIAPVASQLTKARTRRPVTGPSLARDAGPLPHGGIMTYLFIARFLARCALIGAWRCSSAKRRAAFTSLADSDPGHLAGEARATGSRVRHHDNLKLLRSPPGGATIACRRQARAM